MYLPFLLVKNKIMQKGWICLHRQSMENKLYFAETFTKRQARTDILLNANHTDGSFFVRGVEIHIKRGQLGRSELTMADRRQRSRGKVRRFLEGLKTDGQLTLKQDNKTTVITIVNYGFYQNPVHQTVQQTVQQVVQQTDTKQYTNNNDNKNNNEKQINYSEELDLLIESWNSCKSIGSSKGFIKCIRKTNLLKEAYSKVRKSHQKEDIEYSINNYIKEIKKRTPGTGYYDHRFSLYEFLKQNNAFNRFYNI